MLANCWRPVLAAAVVLLAASPALAQEFPFTGVVTGERIHVRAGAGQNYYAVALIEKGALLQVHDHLWGWYMVAPLSDGFSYVSKAFCRAEGDGSRGIITGQRVRVRAPSPAGPEKSYRTQLMLNDGDKVRILGEEGDFYKIAPPQGVRLFVKKELVAAATPQQIAAATRKPAPPTPPVPPTPAPPTPTPPVPTPPVPPTPTPVPPTPAPPTPPVPPTPVPPTPAPPIPTPPTPVPTPPAPVSAVEILVSATGTIQLGEEPVTLESVARRFAQVASADSKTPVSILAHRQVSYQKVVAVMDAAKAAGLTNLTFSLVGAAPEKGGATDAPPLARVVEPESPALIKLEKRFAAESAKDLADQSLGAMSLAYAKLVSDQTLSESDRAVVQSRIDLINTRQQLKSSLAEIATVKEQLQKTVDQDAAKPKSYLVVGRLTTSSLYTGDRLPLLYRVTNPLSNLTIAYIRPTDGA
ncbi:MAG: biopolymer transporter ExbD, partial [Phycisphaerae bacterium]|nr:biopolymer transporter ExbD [Phycisphaerae bacterium]